MGLHLIPYDLKIDFVGMRKMAVAFSLALLLVGGGALLFGGGPKYGIDFAGGTIVQVKFDAPADAEDIKSALEEMNEPGLVVQRFGEDDGRSYLIRFSGVTTSSTELREAVSRVLGAKLAGNPVEIQRLEAVGPKVGADLRSKAVEALYFATLLIAIYISGRFEQRWFIAALMAGGIAGSMYALDFVGIPKGLVVLAATGIMLAMCWKLKLIYALGAVISILHDVFITVGLFVLMGKEFDLTIIAALLTVLGYSLNDTIIIYDRIRENLQAKRSGTLTELINRSVNQTLSRTVLTSGTTLFVVASLLVFGGGIIHDFALVMFIGVIVGTYSSIFVASPVLLLFESTVQEQADAARLAREEEAKTERSRGRALT